MGTSATSFRGRWMWARDGPIGVWMFFAAEAMAARPQQEPWMVALRAHWLVWSRISGGAMMDAQFDRYATDDRRRDILLDVATDVLDQLSAFGDRVPLAVLEAVGTNPTCHRWTRDVEAAYFTRVARGFVNLLRGDQAVSDDATPVEPMPASLLDHAAGRPGPPTRDTA